MSDKFKDFIKFDDHGDGQDRYYELLAENHMHCIFTEAGKEETVGWCRWKRDDNGVWKVTVTGDGPGKAVARPFFGDILDNIHVQLIAEKELL